MKAIQISLRSLKIIQTMICILWLSLLCINCSDVPPAGKITSITTNAKEYHAGDELLINVEIENNSQDDQEYILVINIIQGKSTIYDSHRGSKNKSHNGDDCRYLKVCPLKKLSVSPFYVRIPANVVPGIYEVLVGLRRNPWDPVVDMKGANWCPPACDIEILK